MDQTLEKKTTQDNLFKDDPTFKLADYTHRLLLVFGEIWCAERKTLEHYVTAGRLLIEIKRLLRHGEWLPWLKSHNISPSMAEL